jgi:hypothetical protein
MLQADSPKLQLGVTDMKGRQLIPSKDSVMSTFPLSLDTNAAVNVNPVLESGGRHEVDTWKKSSRPELDRASSQFDRYSQFFSQIFHLV